MKGFFTKLKDFSPKLRFREFCCSWSRKTGEKKPGLGNNLISDLSHVRGQVKGYEHITRRYLIFMCRTAGQNFQHQSPFHISKFYSKMFSILHALRMSQLRDARPPRDILWHMRLLFSLEYKSRDSYSRLIEFSPEFFYSNLDFE